MVPDDDSAPAMVIGDVHGCAAELAELVEAHGSGRRLVFVGDLVAKGPSSREVVAFARGRGALTVRGNHDAHVLKWREARLRGDAPPEMRATHRAVAESLEEADWRYLESAPYAVVLAAFGVIVVHAGLVPGVPLREQAPFDMMNMRSLRSDGTATKRIADGEPWAPRWAGPGHVVYGHDAIRGLQEYPHATGIDTGCVYGRALTALLLPERRLVSVAAHETWCDPHLEDA